MFFNALIDREIYHILNFSFLPLDIYAFHIIFPYNHRHVPNSGTHERNGLVLIPYSGASLTGREVCNYTYMFP